MQGCGFRDLYDQFAALNVQIIGVSFGNPDLNSAWINDQGYQYEIWTDDNRELALYYGAADSTNAFYPDRITRLLDANGNLLLEYNNATASANPNEVLEDCQAIFGE